MTGSISDAVAFMRSIVGTPYEWGGRWPIEPPHYGLDCSGAVCAALDAAGIVPSGYRVRAIDLAYHCAPIAAADAQPGDLVFYAFRGGKVSHVMMVLDAQHVIGAQGGGSETVTEEIARAHGACVKVLPRATYRVGDVVAHGRWRG